MWQIVSTDAQFPSSPAVTEASSIVLRLGRLVHRDPAWAPVRGHRAAARDPAGLAPDLPAFAGVLGAVHEAADAVARMARADLAGISTAAGAGRLYIDSRVIGDDRVAARYIQAPGDRVHLLRNAYFLCADASLRAATALDRLASGLGMPGKSLAIRRAASPGTDIVGPETGYELDPGAFAERMMFFERPRQGHMRPRRDLNASAVIRAREVEKLTLQQIADRFTVSVDAVQKLLHEHGQVREGKRRTAAQLAAMDGPRDARQAVSHAAASRPGQDPAQPAQRSRSIQHARPHRT
jgi:hypothetical protein